MKRWHQIDFLDPNGNERWGYVEATSREMAESELLETVPGAYILSVRALPTRWEAFWAGFWKGMTLRPMFRLGVALARAFRS